MARIGTSATGRVVFFLLIAEFVKARAMHEIVTTVEIDAPATKVWQALTDFCAYPKWNPTIRWIEGTLAPGAILSVLFWPPRSLPVWIRVRTSVVTLEREFRWIGKLLAPRLFAGDHYLTLKPLAADRVELIHGELFIGVLAPLMFRLLANYNRTGFIAMNEALKNHVESGPQRAGSVAIKA